MLKKLNKKVKNLAVRIWKDESAQGMTEYILLVVALVVVLTFFKGQFDSTIRDAITGMTDKINVFIGG